MFTIKDFDSSRFSSVKGLGNIIAISMSNTKNITVIIKNRREKAIRFIWLESNPHSNVLIFSCHFLRDCDFNKYETPTNKITINRRLNKGITIMLFEKNFLIGNQIYFYIILITFRKIISIGICIRIVRQHLQNVNIK